jgi:CDP-diacylglycerol--glycerol-3-phosphate 3-phosphatidyltransferase
MFDKRCRAGVDRSLRPVGARLEQAGVTADQLTIAGLVLSAASAVAIASGWLIVGGLLMGASALPDVLDGAVAKASGTASPRGAFFDSVVDRVSDSLVLGGVAWYLASRDGAHAALLPFAVLAASTVVSYERARAESLGFAATGGLMERAERMMALGVGLAFSVVLVPVLWLMLGLTLVTVVHRFAMVWRQAGSGRRTETDRLLARWRARRSGAGFRPHSGRETSRWRGRDSRGGTARRQTRTRP